MSLQKMMSNYAGYNLWVNRRFTAWLSAKPEELLDKEVPSSYPSILKSLHHIWETEAFWYSVLAELPAPERAEGAGRLAAADVFRNLVSKSEELEALVNAFSEADAEKKIKVVNRWFTCEFPRYEYLLQVVNHGTYHRGQVVTIGRNIGITDASNTDYNFYNVMKERQ